MQTDDGPKETDLDETLIMLAWDAAGFILLSSKSELPSVLNILKKNNVFLVAVFTGYSGDGCFIQKVK